MTNVGENKSIWFDEQTLARLDQIVAEYKRRTGVQPSRSAVVCRAVDALFLAECLTDKTIDVAERQTA
jgi:hypothetical protein